MCKLTHFIKKTKQNTTPAEYFTVFQDKDNSSVLGYGCPIFFILFFILNIDQIGKEQYNKWE